MRTKRVRTRSSRAAKIWLGGLAVITVALSGFALRPSDPPSDTRLLPSYPVATSASATTKEVSAVIRRLLQAQAEGRPAVVSAIGSSLTQGALVPRFNDTWTWQTILILRKATGGQVNLKMHTYPGTTLKAMVRDGVVAKVAADKPDLVIFEASDPNNFSQNIGVGEAESLVGQVIRGLSGKSGPLVVGFVGSPLVGNQRGGRKLADYVAADVKAFKSAKVLVCDVGPAMVKAAAGNLASILPDGVHPNVVGNLAWASAARECLVGLPQ